MNQYRFKILSPQFSRSSQNTEILNSLYETWKGVFSEVLEQKNGKIDPDDFFRQQVLFAIFENEKVVGFNLATVFDFNIANHCEHHFIRGLTEDAINTMRAQNIHRVLTLEYSTIMPEWRKHQSNIVWAEVLISMALLYNDNFQVADAVIGTPRTDVKMDRVGQNVGYFTIKDHIVKMDYPCSVVAETIKKNRKFTTLLTHKIAHQLWNERVDMTSREQQTSITNSKTKNAA
jgi:hypothetical protein